MYKIDAYIRVTVLQAILVVMFVLTSLDFIFALFDELQDTDQFYTWQNALTYVVYTLPRRIYEWLPLSSLAGALIGLGVMASSNELVVIQAAGVRVGRIVWAAMKPTILVMIFSLFLGEYIAPVMESIAKTERAKIQANGNTYRYHSEQWHKFGNEYMHFKTVEPNGLIHGITIFEFNEQKELIHHIFADTAIYLQEQGDNYWLLENVAETIFADSRVSTQSHKSKKWVVDIDPGILKLKIIEPDYMSTADLSTYAAQFEKEGGDSRNLKFSYWKKTLQPLTTGVLVLVAISFVFGPLREATMGYRIFVAISFGLLFNIIQTLIGQVSIVYEVPPLYAVLSPVVLCFMLGILLLRRTT